MPEYVLLVEVNPGLTITSPDLSGHIDQAYSRSLGVVGGAAPYRWKIDGALPPGITFNAATGAFAGTPTATGTYCAEYTVRDDSERVGVATRCIAITWEPLVFTSAAMPNGEADVAYSHTFTVSGGTSPYTYSVSSGQLPDGLSLGGDTVSGTPTQKEIAEFSIAAEDAAGRTVAIPESVEIIGNYSSFMLSTYSPLIQWRMNESSGATAIDSSGNSLDGTYTNVQHGQAPLITDGGTAVLLTSASGDGYIDLAHDARFNTQVFSIVGWFNVGSGTLAEKGAAQTSGTQGWLWGILSTLEVKFQIWDDPGSLWVVTKGDPIATGPHCLGVSVDTSGSLDMYVDGALYASRTTGIPSIVYRTHSFTLGAHKDDSGGFFSHFGSTVDAFDFIAGSFLSAQDHADIYAQGTG